MGFLNRFTNLLHRNSGTAASGVARTAASAPEAPFDHWTRILLADRHMLIISDGDIFERVGPRNWIVYTNNRYATFGDEVRSLVDWLEQQAYETYTAEIRRRL